MDPQLLDWLYAWFDRYAKSFYTADRQIHRQILLKEEHSLIVAGHCRDIAGSLGLDQNHCLLAEAIGICHDVGRFKQVTRYRTFKDRESVNHAHLSVTEMQAAGLAAKFAPGDWEAAAFAISWHNAAAVPPQPDNRLNTFAQIIRDADKLDIYRVMPPAAVSDGFTPKLLADALRGGPLYYQDVHTADDRKLILLSWVYELNYTWTLRRAVENGYIAKLAEALPDTAQANDLKARIKKYITERLGDMQAR